MEAAAIKTSRNPTILREIREYLYRRECERRAERSDAEIHAVESEVDLAVGGGADVNRDALADLLVEMQLAEWSERRAGIFRVHRERAFAP